MSDRPAWRSRPRLPAAFLGALGAAAVVVTGLVWLHGTQGERRALLEDRWDMEAKGPLPGPGWRESDRGLQAGPEGAQIRIELPGLPGRPVYAGLRGAGLDGLLTGAGGRRRTFPAGRAVALQPCEEGPVRLLVLASPGARLLAIEAGVVEQAPSPPPLGWMALAAWFLACLPVLVPPLLHGAMPAREDLLAVALGLACVVSFTLAFHWFGELHLDDAEPDLKSYHRIAQEMQHPLDTGNREPLWPWMLRLWWLLAPASVPASRMLGVFLTPLAVPAAYFILRRLHESAAVALAGAWIVALHDLLAHMAARALRAPLYLLLVTVFLGLCTARGNRWRWLALGVVGALLCLLRLESLALVGLALPVALWRDRPAWRWAVGAGAVFFVLAGGSLAWNAAAHGDPVYPLSKHARGMTNRLEWSERGEAAPVLEDGALYQGESVSPGELFLQKIGPIRSAGRWLSGLARLLILPGSVQLRWFMGGGSWPWVVWITWPLWIAGLVLWILGPRRWGLLLFLAGLHVLPFFAAGIVEPRVFAHLIPLWAGAVALAPVLAARRLLAGRSGAAPPLNH